MRDLIRQTRVDLKSYTAYLGAIAAVLAGWFAIDKITPDMDQNTKVAIVLAPLLPTFLFTTLPKWRERRRQRKLEVFNSALHVSTPKDFRIQPFEDNEYDRKDFKRPDGKDLNVLNWLLNSDLGIHYLTGRSGCGKSSLLQASVLPKLRSKGWTTLLIRLNTTPILAIKKALFGALHKEPKALEQETVEELLVQLTEHGQNPLLLVLDQFEEFLICLEESIDEEIQPLLNLLLELEKKSLPKIKVVIVLRSDYLGLLDTLALPSEAKPYPANWREIPPFSISDGWNYLSSANTSLEGPRLHKLLVNAADEIEETTGMIRPITLNILGLALRNVSQPMKGNTADLIETYLHSKVDAPEVREIAPQIIKKMVCNGIKKPRNLDELSQETQLPIGTVKGCLLNLYQAGLVRFIDREQHIWEITHDFTARQLDLLLSSWHQSSWRKVRYFIAPALILCWLVTLAWAIRAPGQVFTLPATEPGINVEIPELYPIYFAEESLTLTASLATLDRVAMIMKNDPQLELTVLGYETLAQGQSIFNSDEYTALTSRSRARAVARHLYQRGVSKSRIKVIGAGLDRKYDHSTPEGRVSARRVELILNRPESSNQN